MNIIHSKSDPEFLQTIKKKFLDNDTKYFNLLIDVIDENANYLESIDLTDIDSDQSLLLLELINYAKSIKFEFRIIENCTSKSDEEFFDKSIDTLGYLNYRGENQFLALIDSIEVTENKIKKLKEQQMSLQPNK